MSQNFFAVRQRSSGKYLPVPTRHSATHVEFTDSEPPRLFKQFRDAKFAVDWWLKGPAHRKYTTGGWDDPLEEGDIVSIPDPYRKAEDLEIVEVAVTVINK